MAFWAAIIAVVSKETFCRWTWPVGKRIKSSALMASAWGHRSDAFSPIPAPRAVAGAKIHPSWAFLDRVGAVAVALVILQAVWKIGRPCRT
jgi:divalent metal cation (Fe/Co/Zn/Cd) transporter